MPGGHNKSESGLGAIFALFLVTIFKTIETKCKKKRTQLSQTQLPATAVIQLSQTYSQYISTPRKRESAVIEFTSAL